MTRRRSLFRPAGRFTRSIAIRTAAMLLCASVAVAHLEDDTDLDGIHDPLDNCTLVANAGQRDTDADGYGNMCDPDLNNDDVVDFLDLGQMASQFFTADSDADLNGDDVVDFGDFPPIQSLFFGPPGPSGLAP